MKYLDNFLTLLTQHWKIIVTLGSFFVGGGYLIARYRTSGMRKMVNAHAEILDDVTTRLNRLRLELENARDELMEERAQLHYSRQKVMELESRVAMLERREEELMKQINAR